jgi:hypothetical protein
MTQPIGTFRVTKPDGLSRYVEAAGVSDFEAIRLGPEQALGTRINYLNGRHHDCTDDLAFVACCYSTLVQARNAGRFLAPEEVEKVVRMEGAIDDPHDYAGSVATDGFWEQTG